MRMFNLPALLRSVQERVKPPVLVLLGSPGQAAALCAALGDVETVCYQADLHQAGKLRRLLEEHASPTPVAVPPPPEEETDEEAEPEKPVPWVPPAVLTSKVVVEVKPDVWDLPARFHTVIFPVAALDSGYFAIATQPGSRIELGAPLAKVHLLRGTSSPDGR